MLGGQGEGRRRSKQRGAGPPRSCSVTARLAHAPTQPSPQRGAERNHAEERPQCQMSGGCGWRGRCVCVPPCRARQDGRVL
eukprot:10166648-Alexandrium_andersonii.AAC.1